ncbi:MobD protein [Burkholderia sp. Bp9002]|nr:MobD protein [Burkholderia sp. Bp9002]
MPAVTKKELLLLGQTHKNYDVFLIKTTIEGDRWWKMLVVLSPDQAFEVQTAHAKTKVWRRLDIAVDFVTETCP